MNFSVIIPLYNKENHIQRAIKSVLNQTHQQFEIIIVDDGSTDESLHKAKAFNDHRIKLFTRTNGGVSSARNYGIKKSSYDYVGLLDADDTWKPGFLESIKKIINEFPGAGAYATHYEFIDGSKPTPANVNVSLISGSAGKVNYFKSALKSPLITASSVVIKKSIFNEVGYFSTDLTRGEDLEMWCRIALNYPIVYLNETLARYYKNSDNRATGSPSNYSKSIMKYSETILENHSVLDNVPEYFEEYMIKIIMYKVKYLSRNQQGKEARKLLWKYSHTKCNKKAWLKNYILTFRLAHFLYK